MRMKRSQTHAGSARGLGRLVLTNGVAGGHDCSWKNPASWIVSTPSRPSMYRRK
jgi:hypothetical protein